MVFVNSARWLFCVVPLAAASCSHMGRSESPEAASGMIASGYRGAYRDPRWSWRGLIFNDVADMCRAMQASGIDPRLELQVGGRCTWGDVFNATNKALNGGFLRISLPGVWSRHPVGMGHVILRGVESQSMDLPRLLFMFPEEVSVYGSVVIWLSADSRVSVEGQEFDINTEQGMRRMREAIDGIAKRFVQEGGFEEFASDGSLTDRTKQRLIIAADVAASWDDMYQVMRSCTDASPAYLRFAIAGRK